jgi:hypothetical protein
MAGIKIEFYDEAKANGQNCYGRYLGGKEDASTSTTRELGNYVAGAVLMSITSQGKDHYVQTLTTAASTASNRILVLSGQTRDYEIPLSHRSTAAKYTYASCT